MKLDANEVEFKAVVGDEYKNKQMKLLVIGRATNGWEESGKNAFEELLEKKNYNILEDLHFEEWLSKCF